MVKLQPTSYDTIFFTWPTVHIYVFTGFSRITDYRKYTETSSQTLNYIKYIPRAWNELKSQNNRSINHVLFIIIINVCVIFSYTFYGKHDITI